MSAIQGINVELIGWLQLLKLNTDSYSRESRVRFVELQSSFSRIRFTVDSTTEKSVLEIYERLSRLTQQYKYDPVLSQKVNATLQALAQQ